MTQILGNGRFHALVIALLLLTACGEQVARNDVGEVIAGGDIDVFDTKVGDCFNDTVFDAEVTDIPGVPCAEPHDNEIFALYDTTVTSYPGEDELLESANTKCIASFDSYVGVTYDNSILDVFPLIPTLDSWKLLNDREIICVLYHLEQEKLTGSMHGSRI